MQAGSAARLTFGSRRKRRTDFGPFGILFELESSGANFNAITSCCSDAREEDDTYNNGSVTVCDGDHVILHFLKLTLSGAAKLRFCVSIELNIRAWYAIVKLQYKKYSKRFRNGNRR